MDKDLMQLAHHLVRDMLLLLAVLNPLVNLPIYLQLTEGQTSKQRRHTYNLAVLTAAGLVIFFSLLGDWMLRMVFRVSLSNFQAAAGVLLFIVAAKGVLATDTTPSGNSGNREGIAVFPMAFPLLAGPGTMAITILMAQQSGGLWVLAVAAVTFPIAWLIMQSSQLVNRALGRLGTMVVARILFIFLAAMATELIFIGVRAGMHIK